MLAFLQDPNKKIARLNNPFDQLEVEYSPEKSTVSGWCCFGVVVGALGKVQVEHTVYIAGIASLDCKDLCLPRVNSQPAFESERFL
jgi:hypothetical protein